MEFSIELGCLRILLINVAIDNAYHDCEGNVCKYWTRFSMFGSLDTLGELLRSVSDPQINKSY